MYLGYYDPDINCLSCKPPFRCLPCQAGTYREDNRQPTCGPCPVAAHSAQNASSKCEACPKGTYGGVQGSSVCLNCRAGMPPFLFIFVRWRINVCHAAVLVPPPPYRFIASHQAFVFLLSTIGTYSNVPGLSVCVACAMNYYSPTDGATSCMNCSLNWEAREGSSSCTYCVPPAFRTAETGLCQGSFVCFFRLLDRVSSPY